MDPTGFTQWVVVKCRELLKFPTDLRQWACFINHWEHLLPTNSRQWVVPNHLAKL